MKFRQWLEAEWPVPWPLRQGTGERIKDRDTPPEVTPTGDYILYHGTCGSTARIILKEQRLLRDDIGVVGVTTIPGQASVFACMKYAKDRSPSNAPTVLKAVIDKDWLLKQEITREVGGSGHDQWLIRAGEVPLKHVEVHSIYGTHPPDEDDFKAVMGL